MPDIADLDAWPSSGCPEGLAEVVLCASAEEVAFAAELAALDRVDEALDPFPGGDVEDLEDLPAWEVAVAGVDELVASLSGSVHEADLMLLASIDPRSLSENLVRVEYLRALDRIAGRVAALRHDVVVAMVGERSSEAYLPEVALEAEISVARRTSRYAAGKAIEVARALASTFPGFAAALRDGRVSDAHCAVLVERTRVVADEGVLAEVERRVGAACHLPMRMGTVVREDDYVRAAREHVAEATAAEAARRPTPTPEASG